MPVWANIEQLHTAFKASQEEVFRLTTLASGPADDDAQKLAEAARLVADDMKRAQDAQPTNKDGHTTFDAQAYLEASGTTLVAFLKQVLAHFGVRMSRQERESMLGAPPQVIMPS